MHFGYEPDRNDSTNQEGWFLFRNSYGSGGFASNWQVDGGSPKAPTGGYGHIRTSDVDKYCWEYMYRKSF